jgi:hypothetical protein
MMQRKLRQAQRLEAVGTLAGGIAHDFNNILGAILGYGEMALRDAPAESRLRRDVESILGDGERGRTLVDRVLTFSRSGVGERIPVHVEKGCKRGGHSARRQCASRHPGGSEARSGASRDARRADTSASAGDEIWPRMAYRRCLTAERCASRSAQNASTWNVPQR